MRQAMSIETIEKKNKVRTQIANIHFSSCYA